MTVVADTLRQARQARRISLNQAALETRIRQSILEALEEGDYAALPPRPFLRGLLRNYAVYLNLDADAVLDDYDGETGAAPVRRTSPSVSDPANESSMPAPIPAIELPLQDQIESDEPAFPPFQIETGAHPDTEPRPRPPHETESLTPDLGLQVPPPTAPLNLPQEPPTFGQKIGSTRIPELVAIIAIAIALFFLVSQGFGQVQQLVNPLTSPPTPRPTMTASPTIPIGSTPTGIPTLPQTIVPPTSPIILEPTLALSQTATATSLPEIISPTATITIELPVEASMTLEIRANGEVGAWVIVDEDTVINGILKNETRTFTARARLFMQIKNIENGSVFFQGTRILPRDQQERSLLSRAWLINPLGTPVIVPPTPYPSPVTPTEFPSATPSPSGTPTRTAIPTMTPTATLTLTPSPSVTASSTATRTATITATTAISRTVTFTPTVTRSRTPTATPSLTP